MLSNLTLADAATFQVVAGFALLAIGCMSLLAFLLRRRLALRGVMALHMLNLLVVALALLVLFQPKGMLYGGPAIALLRAMSKFENTDRQ